MDSGHGKMRTNAEGDRLSSLPDELIHKILSFIDIKGAIGTSTLSSRWRFIWTSMPCLNFSSEDFYINDREDFLLRKFIKFAKNVLSRRNNRIQVSSIKLGCEMCEPEHVKKIMEYAFSYHVEHVTLTELSIRKYDFPVSLLSSESLKHLILAGSRYSQLLIPASTRELLALTTLHLDYFTFYDDDTDKGVGLFSKCTNLQNLTLSHCEVKGLDGFHICHPRISNLTLENGDGKIVNVVAPKLVNLIIRDCGGKHLISAPELAYLLFKGYNPLQVSADGFPSLETMHLCIYNSNKADVRKIIGFLQQLNTVKFLTVNLELVEFLSSHSKLISCQPSPFANLKSLKISPESLDVDRKKSMSTKVKNYFLSSSPRAAFTMISRELEKEKVDTQRNMARITQVKPQVMNQMAQLGTQMQHHIWGSTTPIKNCWEDLNLQIDQGKSKINTIVRKLEYIEGFLAELPASKRAMIQASFSSLCEEANTVINQIMDCMKIHWSEEQSRLNVYFQDLVVASHPSS